MMITITIFKLESLTPSGNETSVIARQSELFALVLIVVTTGRRDLQRANFALLGLTGSPNHSSIYLPRLFCKW